MHPRMLALAASRTALIASAATLFAAAPPLVAQAHDHSMAGMEGMHDVTISPVARREIDSVARATLPLGGEGKAKAAGFHPVFGWIPTMGTHWIDQGLMTKARQQDRNAPSQLMFSRIGGKDSLVGAAYGYFTAANDSSMPALFDGAPSWHEHKNLAPPGQTLVMLHVWFVPSPDGPFAGTNPNLPFWALGLAAPDSARMHDAAFSARVRRASLALAEIADTTSIFPQLEQRPDVRPVLAAQRDSIRALVPEFLAAQRANDAARFDRAADKAGAHWDAIYAAYVATARTPAGKQRIEEFVSMLLGHHEH
jgi:hypothetical protein